MISGIRYGFYTYGIEFNKDTINNIEKFICILAGHVHTNFEANVNENLKQITTSSALIGVGREIIIK